MEDPALLARLQSGRELPIEGCNCRHCGNEFFMAALSAEWMPNFCPYCGIKFIGKTTDGEPGEYAPQDVAMELMYERDAAESAADEMASMVLGECIDWPCHDDAWRRAIETLRQSR